MIFARSSSGLIPTSRSVLVFLTAARMALNCLFLCHLLACFMVLSGPGYLRGPVSMMRWVMIPQQI